MTGFYAVIGASCLADGHPSECTEPATGTIENADEESPLQIDGVAVADHGDRMDYSSHAHAHNDTDGCNSYSSHSLIPDQEPPWTVDGRPLMKEGNDTTDPGSGGRAWIDNGGQTDFELVD